MNKAVSARTAKVAAPTYMDAELRHYYSQVFLVMGLGLALTGFVAYLLSKSPNAMSWFMYRDAAGAHSTWFYWFVVFVQIILAGTLGGFEGSNVTFRKGLNTFIAFALLTGLTMTPQLHLYTDASMARVFFITASTFGACALWGYTTRINLAPWGSFLLIGLMGLIVAMITNSFLHSSALNFVVSCVGVLLFAGLTAWDMKKLRALYDANGGSAPGLVISGAAALYLDFINLFLFFLNLSGTRDND